MTEDKRNFYAISPTHSPGAAFILARSDEEALDDAIYYAAHDAVRGDGSPAAAVWCIARDIEYIGEAQATDAPWKWAHPGVENNAAELARIEEEFDAGIRADCQP